jgi:hypothetical protein
MCAFDQRYWHAEARGSQGTGFPHNKHRTRQGALARFTRDIRFVLFVLLVVNPLFGSASLRENGNSPLRASEGMVYSPQFTAMGIRGTLSPATRKAQFP